MKAELFPRIHSLLLLSSSIIISSIQKLPGFKTLSSNQKVSLILFKQSVNVLTTIATPKMILLILKITVFIIIPPAVTKHVTF
jgi:hypothetical protein